MDIVLTIEEANLTLINLISVDDISNANILLADEQSAIIEIGNEIEKTEGYDPKIISHLEEYCELLWKCSITETKEEKLNLCHVLKKYFTQTIRTLILALPEQYDMVFLPYKASMWDSLESVWIAAKEYTNCNRYVIPIPYFDKNQDGTLGHMHYEGDMLPDYVPITDYQEYNISLNHPEVIFFHNPYDQYNYVSSVHPDFYSKELKNNTDILVYIPYFVTEDDVEEHLCSNIGVYMADRVIVQSDKVRDTYIRSYIKTFIENRKKTEDSNGISNKEYMNRIMKQAEYKFINLGSPKFDKVINSNSNDFPIPEEWDKRIGNRKVILYNTSIAALLSYKDIYLKKMRSVFNHFSQRDDVVLWWRPHPLFLSTLETMASQLSEEYSQLVSEFLKTNCGIYDDTVDLHRAIAVSDAYYGDGGSLLAMYKFTDKPIMVQNFDISS